MKTDRRLAGAALLALGALMALGLASRLAGADVKLPNLELRDTHLDNGLRVILVPDHSAPVYAINVTYNVGSRNEHPGRTGFAHLFEHMMFEGSYNVGQGRAFHARAEQRRRHERHHERGPHESISRSCPRTSSIWACSWKSDRMRSLIDHAGESR